MSWITRTALAAGLAAGLGGFPAAQAAPTGGGAALAVAAAGQENGLLQEVRWVQRCRPVTVYRRDRYGRTVRAVRTQCRRAWIGPGRRY